jgi:hypothetical protein
LNYLIIKGDPEIILRLYCDYIEVILSIIIVKFIEFIWPEAQCGREKYYFVGVFTKGKILKKLFKEIIIEIIIEDLLLKEFIEIIIVELLRLLLLNLLRILLNY